MPSTTFTVSPKSLHDLRGQPQGQDSEPHPTDSQASNYHHPITPVDSNRLSPYSSQLRSNTASPDANSYTPAESISTYSNYQPSDYSSDFGDPFFGADFNSFETSIPNFFGESDFLALSLSQQPSSQPSPAANDVGIPSGYPMSPRKSPSTSAGPFDEKPRASADIPAASVSPIVSNPPRPSVNSVDSEQSSPQLTPDTTSGDWSRSSTDSAAPPISAMTSQSPRVTVSVYGPEGEPPVQGFEGNVSATAESPQTMRGEPRSLAGDLAGAPAYGGPSAERRGLPPGERPSDEVPSPNQQAARHQVNEKNKEIFSWVYGSDNLNNDPNNPPRGNDNTYFDSNAPPPANDDGIPDREIPLGDATENRRVPGQVYYQEGRPAGPLNDTDRTIISELRTWGDAPALSGIQRDRNQPESSQAAMQRYMRQCQDNESIVSRAATWGTRRRSLPSVMDEEGVISGNFLKKLSISGHSRRPSFISRMESLVRRQSSASGLKRKGSNASELPPEIPTDEGERRESKDNLAPPSRTSSWGTKKPTPSLNTTLVGIATNIATIGSSHARTGSISAATPITSPRSPFGSFSNALNVPVKNTLRRPRSKTELPRHSNPEGASHPHLVGMLKKQGGPPVAQLAKSQSVPDQDDDDDEDDDNFDDADMKADLGRLEEIIPTLEGFKQHILRLNPGLEINSYLVERIAYQLVSRYKQLCGAKVKHLNQVSQRKCPSGIMCIASGGAAIPLDSRGDTRGVDPLSARPESSDGDITPLDGAINPDSFPQGIPMPPATSLPAEFECQLCFNSKKFQKPSDWTKHVHEDVQPFTCTWGSCKEPKMFKRKADWVRHENEGHRHLEWWTCDFEDCHHTCYRRDNFLQHLVREHKFTEPKIKTKAAIKRAGGGDLTWQKVEQCHVETPQRPNEEPCRFCGKCFPTWKKLTVHLAKHMEHISLPVLRLVAAKDLDTDTIISPVQDLPPRNFGPPPVPIIKEGVPPFNSPVGAQSSQHASPLGYQEQATFASAYHGMPQTQPPLQAPYYPQQAQLFSEMASQPGPGLVMPQVTTGLNPQSQYHTQHMPVTTGPYGPPVEATYMNMPNHGNMNQGGFAGSGLEPFPAYNPLGIQDQTASMGYDGFVDSTMQQQQPPVEQYSSHGSVSPYSHSPHQGHGGFYNQ